MAQRKGHSSDDKTFFGLDLYLEAKCCKNLQSGRGSAQVNSVRVITWLV